VELGGAIELHAAFRNESRTSLPSVSAARRKSGKAKKPLVVFSQGKPLLANFFGTTVIANPLYKASKGVDRSTHL
jgi:hypothetical protein